MGIIERQWRMAIMKYSTKTKLDKEANRRDGYVCVECGKQDGIETHHIIPEVEELANLITLCHSCHKRYHNMAGCFQKGYDKRRSNLLVGQKLMKERMKKEYFNRHIGSWVKRNTKQNQ